MKGDRGTVIASLASLWLVLRANLVGFPCKIILRLPHFPWALAQDTSCTSRRPSSSAQKSVHRVEGRSSKTHPSTAFLPLQQPGQLS